MGPGFCPAAVFQGGGIRALVSIPSDFDAVQSPGCDPKGLPTFMSTSDSGHQRIMIKVARGEQRHYHDHDEVQNETMSSDTCRIRLRGRPQSC